MRLTHYKMTITYNHKIINPFEEVIVYITNGVFSLFRQVSRLPLIIGWVLGLALLITIGTIFTIVFYLPLLLSRRQIKSEMKSIINGIDQLDQRSAMELHSLIEECRIFFDKTDIGGRGFYVFLPLTHEIRKTSNHFKQAELALFKKAYPDFEKPLTSQEEQELISTFKGWKEDWADEKMNIYND